MGHCQRPKPHSQGLPCSPSVPGARSLPRQEQRDQGGGLPHPGGVEEGVSPSVGARAAWRGGASDSSVSRKWNPLEFLMDEVRGQRENIGVERESEPEQPQGWHRHDAKCRNRWRGRFEGVFFASWELCWGCVGPEMDDSSGGDKEGESVFDSGV